jgi:hypothetical protein
MFVLSNTILSVHTRTRKLRKSALLKKKLMKSTRKILPSRVSIKNTNRSIKVSVNHPSKCLIYG